MLIEFDQNTILGRGGYGCVFLGKLGDRQVAVKRVYLHHLNEREVNALTTLKGHPNVVELFLPIETQGDFR